LDDDEDTDVPHAEQHHAGVEIPMGGEGWWTRIEIRVQVVASPVRYRHQSRQPAHRHHVAKLGRGNLMDHAEAIEKLVLVVDGLIGAVNELALQAAAEHDLETGVASAYMERVQAELDAVRTHLGARSWDEVHPVQPPTPQRHLPPHLRTRGRAPWRRS
jgi:hypothetical protein